MSSTETEETEDWEELDLEESEDAITVDVDLVDDLTQEADRSGPYGCFGH